MWLECRSCSCSDRGYCGCISARIIDSAVILIHGLPANKDALNRGLVSSMLVYVLVEIADVGVYKYLQLFPKSHEHLRVAFFASLEGWKILRVSCSKCHPICD